MNKEKIGIKSYIKKYKSGVFFHILCYIFASITTVLITISLANSIEQLTLLNYKKAIYSMIATMVFVVFNRIFGIYQQLYLKNIP